MRWYRSFLAVRGPAPIAKAAIPKNTAPKATRFAINAVTHRLLEPRKSAIAPHNKQSLQRTVCRLLFCLPKWELMLP